MRIRGWMIHGVWAGLALGAFVAGRGSVDRRSEGVVAPGGGARGSLRPPSASPDHAVLFSGPGDSPDEFARELAAVLAEEDEEVRQARIADLAGELTPTVLDGLDEHMVRGVLQLFEAPDSFDFTWHRQKPFFRAWARLNPEAAFAYVTDPEKPSRATSYGSGPVIEEWAKLDMDAAQAALATLENDITRHNMGLRLMKVLLESDPAGAVAYSAKLWREERSISGISQIVKHVRQERGLAGFDEWLTGSGVAGLGDEPVEYQQEAVEALAYRGNKAEIAELLAANANDRFVNAALLREVAEDLTLDAENRYRAQLDWIGDLPDVIGAKGEAIRTNFERYLRYDFDAAGEWLAGQNLGPAHDEAIEIFVRNATMDDVPAAMRWAEQVSDPALRAATVQYVRDRGGARGE